MSDVVSKKTRQNIQRDIEQGNLGKVRDWMCIDFPYSRQFTNHWRIYSLYMAVFMKKRCTDVHLFFMNAASLRDLQFFRLQRRVQLPVRNLR
jgi:hypothetical protein